MAVRQLGDWSPLDETEDPIHADPELVEQARVRYQKIATTIEDSVARLKKVVDSNSDSLVGKYVEGIVDSARSVHDSLVKAKARYVDVAREIKTYQPELDDALTETAGALVDAKNARSAQQTASGMPDAQPAPDGTVPADEQAKDQKKKRAIEDADNKLTAAKNRLRTAMEGLDRAGKRFGDAVNCKNYNDGLTDKVNWRVTEILKWVSKIFSFIAIALGILACFIPGVGVIVAGLVAGAVALAVDVALYAAGEGSVVDVIMAAVGLAAFGLAAFAALRGLAGVAKAANTGRATQTGIRLDFLGPGGRISSLPGRQPTGGPAAAAVPTFSVPNFGIWRALGLEFKNVGAMWKMLLTAPGSFLRTWAAVISGLTMAPSLAAALGMSTLTAGWFAKGLAVFIGTFGIAGIIYTALRQDYPGRQNPVIPPVNP